MSISLFTEVKVHWAMLALGWATASVRDGSVPKMCTSGGHQCKTAPIPGLCVLVPPSQTWTFPLNNVAIKVPNWPKYERDLYNFFRFLVCSQYFKFSFHFICCQVRFRQFSMCRYKSLQMDQNMGIKAHNFFRFWVCF